MSRWSRGAGIAICVIVGLVMNVRAVSSEEFTRITEGIVVNDPDKSLGCNWGDYNNDGDLDLFAANWGNRDNALYSNSGDGTFTKEIGVPISSDVGNSTGGSWGDCNDDGYLDLFIANSGGQDKFLYLSNGDGTLTKVITG